MIKRVPLFIGVFVALMMLTSTALAQDQWPQDSDPTWQASYWNNMTLSGSPVLQRSEANLDYDWGTGSPGPGVDTDHFSARWTRYIDEQAGTYRFTAASDDGIRVWVDGDLIVNDWSGHSCETVSADKYLSAGHHLVKVEFYDNTVAAVARVSWVPTYAPVTNWRGEYFNNTALSGNPALVRDDADVNFDWGAGSPASGVIGADGFSVRWTRDVSLPAGMYRFTMRVDDGGRLWVNNHLLIDAWRDQDPTTYTGDIYLPGGAIPIKMEYYENTVGALVQLSWALADGSSSAPSAGVVVVDDTDVGFVKGGVAAGWRTVPEGYGNRLTWTRNNDRVRWNYNWARWYPSLAPGRYEVYAYIPERYTTTAHARYWISHAGGYSLRIVNQSVTGSRWVSLGTYWFRGTRADYVSLADVTFEPRVTRLIGFDAVKWEPR